MFKTNKNKISNEVLFNMVCEHTDILKKIVTVLESLNNDNIQRDRTIMEICKNLDFKSVSDTLDFYKKIIGQRGFKVEDILNLIGEEDHNIEHKMDSLCGIWRTSSQKQDSKIVISKLPDQEYVFTYKPVEADFCTSSFIIGNILEELPTYVDIDGQDVMIHYEEATDDNPEVILFNRMLYFRDSDF